MSDSRTHWNQIYSENLPDEVSWYQERSKISLRLIEAAGINPNSWVIDVGGGASTLVDDLLGAGFKNLAVLDISAASLAHAKKRLGDRAQAIEWLEVDVTKFQPTRQYALWHDRATFHFLTNEGDRQSYLRKVKEAVVPSGHLVIATFAVGGPKKCSGLDIVQYDATTLKAFFGNEFDLQESELGAHRTPWGEEQKFVYCRFRRR